MSNFSVTTPFPKTKLWDYYVKNNKNPNISWDNFVYAGVGNKTSPVFESGELNRQAIQEWVSRAYKEFLSQTGVFYTKVGDSGL